MPDHYIALTRKYRPRSFDDIVSQEHVSSTLKNAIENNRISHAYMFCGPRGVGKTTMARVLARTINGIDADVDGEALGNTLSIIEIDAASNNKVDDIHRIRETVRIPPQNSRYKIYIIDEVHMLSKQAYNALLKTLEEPPAHVIFIFATTEPQKVLPTIMSRCQRYDFRRIKITELVDRLKFVCKQEKITIDDESLHVIAHKADGALRDALGLLDQAIAFCGSDIRHEELLQALNVVSSDRLFELTQATLDHDTTAGIHIIDDLLQKGYDVQELIASLTEHFRNLYLALDQRNMELIETSEDTRKRYATVAQQLSEDDLMRMLHLANEAQFKIREAGQPRIQLEIVILKLITMTRAEGLHELLEELRRAQSGRTGQEGSSSADSSVSYDPDPVASPGNKKLSPPATVTDPAPQETGHTSAPQPDTHGIFDKPALTRPRNQAVNPALAGYHQGALAPAPQTPPEEAGSISGNLALVPQADMETEPLHLHELKDEWERFIAHLEQQTDLSQAVILAFRRLQPADLDHHEVLLPCHDSFTLRILEENSRRLGRELRGYFHRPLSLRIELRKSNKKQEINDPYARFKQLQEKDPAIRLIVDLFGAELEY